MNTKEEILELKRKFKADTDEIKRKMYETSERNKEIEKENKSLQDKINSMVDKSELEKCLNDKETQARQIVDLTDTVNKLKKQNKLLVSQRNTYKSQLSKLEKGEATPKYLNWIAEENKKLQESKKEVNQLKVEIKDLKDNLNNEIKSNKGVKTIQHMINKMYNTLSYENLHYYGTKFDELTKLVRRMRAVNNSLNANYNVQYTIKDAKFGYINEYNTEIVFYDIDGNGFTISLNDSKQRDLFNYYGYPCKAYLLDNERVVIDEIYTEISVVSQIKQKEAIKKSNSNFHWLEEIKMKYDKELSVLLIGSRNKEEYTRMIKKIGLEVIWFNPFESNVTRLEDIKDKADIIIALKDHISHSVLDFIDTKDKNVLLLGKDSRNLVLSSINFLIHKLNLANIININDENKGDE